MAQWRRRLPSMQKYNNMGSSPIIRSKMEPPERSAHRDETLAEFIDRSIIRKSSFKTRVPFADYLKPEYFEPSYVYSPRLK